MARAFTPEELAVQIPVAGAVLHGELTLPEGTESMIVFAHGSGSSRRSPRNRFVAGALNRARHGTLLMDLLTEAEEREDMLTREYRFDIALLARRLTAAVDWIVAGKDTSMLRVGTFGASTGAAAALIAAADRPHFVGAVVSRGGRPDLAGESLPQVAAPTLLIVGGSDDVVIELNREALAQLRCEKRMEVVPRATHLFEEPGTLETVAHKAADWFTAFLA